MQQSPPQLHPIDRDLMHRICLLSYGSIQSQYDQKLSHAALTLMYYACMRVGEAVKSVDVEHAVKFNNVRINKNPTLSATIYLVSFKHSKKPKELVLYPSPDQPVCPIATLQEYLNVRVHGSDTLFNDIAGNTATRQFIADKLKHLVARAGLDPTRYNTHSIRIGRTTDMAKAGVPEAIIRETGRWDSEAFKKYIRFPAFELPR